MNPLTLSAIVPYLATVSREILTVSLTGYVGHLWIRLDFADGAQAEGYAAARGWKVRKG